MWKCPICSNEANREYVCGKCGYDERKDFIRWRTFYPVPRQDKNERMKMVSKAVKRKENEKEAERQQQLRLEEETRRQQYLRLEEETRRQLQRLEEQEQAMRKHVESAVEKAVREVEEEKPSYRTEEKGQKEGCKKRKKGTWVKIIAGICVVGLFASPIIGKMLETGYGSQTENFSSNHALSSWKAMEAALIDALKSGEVNYESDSMNQICDYLEEQGFFLSRPEALPENIQQGTMVNQRAWAQLNGGNHTQYDVYFDDWYGSGASSWHERELYFSDSRRYDDFVEDETLCGLYKKILPLPYEIEFGYTFEEVFQKLGLTDEMVAYGTDIANINDVHLLITMPEVQDGNIVNGSIFISIDNYTFSFSFTDQNELDHYSVGIQH